jgi:hypothetical protein
MMARLHAVKRHAANREWVIIGTRDVVVWRQVMIDNEAGGGEWRSLNYIEDKGYQANSRVLPRWNGDSW